MYNIKNEFADNRIATFIIRDIEVRGNAIVDDVQPESQEMEQLWRQFFATVLDEAIKIRISISSVGR